MTESLPHRDLTVQAVLDSWPAAAWVFMERHMACVGCDMAPFMTVAEAAASYGIASDVLEAELRRAAHDVAAGPCAGPSSPRRPDLGASVENSPSTQCRSDTKRGV